MMSHGMPSHGSGKRSGIKALGRFVTIIANHGVDKVPSPLFRALAATPRANQAVLAWGKCPGALGGRRGLPGGRPTPQGLGEPRSHRSGFSPDRRGRSSGSIAGRAGVWGVAVLGCGEAARRGWGAIGGGRE